MKKYIDLNQVFQKGVFTHITSRNTDKYVITGTTIYSMPADCRTEKSYRQIEETYGITFFYDDKTIQIPFYCVPLIDFFAADENGYFGTLGGFTDLDQDSAIYYIGKNREVRFAAENLRAFLSNGFLRISPLPPQQQDILLFETLTDAQKQLPFVSVDD